MIAHGGAEATTVPTLPKMSQGFLELWVLKFKLEKK